MAQHDFAAHKSVPGSALLFNRMYIALEKQPDSSAILHNKRLFLFFVISDHESALKPATALSL